MSDHILIKKEKSLRSVFRGALSLGLFAPLNSRKWHYINSCIIIMVHSETSKGCVLACHIFKISPSWSHNYIPSGVGYVYKYFQRIFFFFHYLTVFMIFIFICLFVFYFSLFQLFIFICVYLLLFVHLFYNYAQFFLFDVLFFLQFIYFYIFLFILILTSDLFFSPGSFSKKNLVILSPDPWLLLTNYLSFHVDVSDNRNSISCFRIFVS